MLEMAVHSPIPDGEKERLSKWGWPDENQSWTWPDSKGKKLHVNVYSRYPKVRLEVNGKPIREKEVSEDTKLTASFEVPYEAGELRVSGIRDGRVVEHKILKTTGKPASLRLTADRTNIHADRNDLSYVTVEVIDAHGQKVPGAELPIRFKVEGPGEIAALGNGNPHDVKSFQSKECASFKGRCLAIVRPAGYQKGTIKLKVTSDRLKSASVSIETR